MRVGPYSTTTRLTVSDQYGISWAVRWLDGPAARPLVLQFADDHHAFHEDAKPGGLFESQGLPEILVPVSAHALTAPHEEDET